MYRWYVLDKLQLTLVAAHACIHKSRPPSGQRRPHHFYSWHGFDGRWKRLTVDGLLDAPLRPPLSLRHRFYPGDARSVVFADDSLARQAPSSGKVALGEKC